MLKNKTTKNLIKLILVLAACSFTASVKAQTTLPAFPDAEGFGANAIGGRGGAVIKVTNLNDSGPGSFRTAVAQNYPRIVEFEVSGIINLDTNIVISNPFITIAGQTSPGGILIAGRSVTINTNDVIIQHLRFRTGSHKYIPNSSDAETARSLDIEGDYVKSWFPNKAYNIILDHCSVSWGIDQVFTVGADATNITLQRSIISEGLSNAGHPKGEHSKGLLIDTKYATDDVIKVSMHHNYIAHNRDRNPLVSGTKIGFLDAVNNVIYNFGGGLSMATQENGKANWIHNYIKYGPNSNYPNNPLSSDPLAHKWDAVPFEAIHIAKNFNSCNSPILTDINLPKIYAQGNVGLSRADQLADEWSVGYGWCNSTLNQAYRKVDPWPAESVVAEEMSYDYAQRVVDAVGATKPVRDSVDTRVVNDFKNGTGTIINNVKYPDDFPTFQNLPAPTDADNDGMADNWENKFGQNLNPNDIVPAHISTRYKDYTYVEFYLGELADGTVENPLPSCVLSNAYFIPTQAEENTDVVLAVEGTNCDGKSVAFNMEEYDPISNGTVNVQPSIAAFSNNIAKTIWKAEWQDDGLGGGDPEYFFTATLDNDKTKSIQSSNDEAAMLKVSKIIAAPPAPQTESADAGAMMAIKTTRITHPAHDMRANWSTYENPWSKNFDRILIYENAACLPIENPDPNCHSRQGLYWADIDELKNISGGTVDQYEAATTKVFPSGYSDYAYWSIYDNDIIYGINLNSRQLVKINVATKEITPLTYLPLINTASSGMPRIHGWTTGGELIVMDDYNALKSNGTAGEGWASNGYVINVLNPNLSPDTDCLTQADCKRYESGWPDKCTEDNYKFQGIGASTIHDAPTSDEKLVLAYGGSAVGSEGARNFDWTLGKCASPPCLDQPKCNAGGYQLPVADWPDAYSVPTDVKAKLEHCSGVGSESLLFGKTNNDWVVCGTMSEAWSTAGYHPAPYLNNTYLYQIIFNRNTHKYTHVELMPHYTTGYRVIEEPGDYDHNYFGGIMNPNLRKDSKQVMFVATDGKFSYEDYLWCQKNSTQTNCPNILAGNYTGLSMFLTDLAPKNGNIDTEAPSIPANLQVNSVTENQIDLSWNASTDNVGVVGYKVYRDNIQIGTVTTLSYADNNLQSGASYEYTVSAYDAADLESAKSNILAVKTNATPAMEILKTATLPVIDGNLLEYTNANAITFAPAFGGNTLTVKALWDNSALYLAFDVADSQLNADVVARDGAVWNEDAIEWGIDVDSDTKAPNPNSAYLLPGDFHGISNILNTIYDEQGSINGVPQSSWNGTWESAVKINGTINDDTDTDVGYVLEIKIPWTELGLTGAPNSDSLLRVGLLLDDKDQSGIQRKIWLGNFSSFQNPANWQTVLLSNKEIIPLNPADLNGDTKVNIRDIQIVIKVITGAIADPATVLKTDLNNDTKVNIRDIQLIIKVIVNK